jgi:hypothetical protein
VPPDSYSTIAETALPVMVFFVPSLGFCQIIPASKSRKKCRFSDFVFHARPPPLNEHVGNNHHTPVSSDDAHVCCTRDTFQTRGCERARFPSSGAEIAVGCFLPSSQKSQPKK